jgi:two-component system alkaline phosphatase synthesis response regulator PhoP
MAAFILTPPEPEAPPSRRSLTGAWKNPGAEAVKHVLIIDDETGLVQAVRHNLELDGHAVIVESDGERGVAQVKTFNPDLVITDLLVLEAGRHTLLPRLRAEAEAIPVLVLAFRAEEATELRGFRMGIDDFLLRPFGISELHHRIDALLGLSASLVPVVDASNDSADASIRFGDIEVFTGSRTVLRNGSTVTLRLKEFDLLMTLISRGGRVATRVDLLREVWGYRTWVATRTVDTHVAELRRKLEKDPARPEHILTVRKVGYRLDRGHNSHSPHNAGD